MARFFGKRSGFDNLRDLLLFGVGVAGLVKEIFFNGGAPPNIELIVACASLAGAPYIIRKDKPGGEK